MEFDNDFTHVGYNAETTIENDVDEMDSWLSIDVVEMDEDQDEMPNMFRATLPCAHHHPQTVERVPSQTMDSSAGKRQLDALVIPQDDREALIDKRGRRFVYDASPTHELEAAHANEHNSRGIVSTVSPANHSVSPSSSVVAPSSSTSITGGAGVSAGTGTGAGAGVSMGQAREGGNIASDTGTGPHKHKHQQQHQQTEEEPKISFMNFEVGSIALFVPVGSDRTIWMAFHSGKPNRFLAQSSLYALTHRHGKTLEKSRILAKIVCIEEHVVPEHTTHNSGTANNPFKLSAGSTYYLCYAEPVTVVKNF